MRQSVLLYNPYAVFYTMPLGLLAIGSALDPSRYTVEIIDGRLEHDPLTTVLSRVDEALCLGVTVLTGGPIRDALRVSRAVKAKRPDLPVVWGGWHPSLFQTACLDEPSVDVTVAGQGEDTFAEIVDRLSARESLDGCAGCAFRRNGEVVVNPPRPLRNVDDLPAHHYDLIPVERYFSLKGQRQIDYISSQGCRFRCAFCADPFVYERGWVGLSPKRMGREVAALSGRYRFKDLAFQDETFFTSAKRVEAICDAFLAAGLTITWTATMRADQGVRLEDALFEKAKHSGLRRVMIGVESGSQQMLDWMKKDITIEQVRISAEKCVRHGIGAIFPVIVGFPGESDESVAETMRFVKLLRRMSPQFETPIFFYQPYPGSPIADEVARTGYPMPKTLDEWAEFDYVGSYGSWVNREKRRTIQRFKFYQRHAFGIHPSPLHRPLQMLSRWRCDRDFYGLPVEKVVVDWLHPAPQLS